jgi:hypothetical protein
MNSSPSLFAAPERNFENKECGKKRVHLPIGIFLLNNLTQKTALKELMFLYLSSNEDKPTDRAFRKAANQLADEGKIIIERREQLWLFPIPPQSKSPDENGTETELPLLPRKIDKRIHSTHKIKFSMEYEGEQPKEGGVENIFGRYRTARQYIFHKGNHTVGTYAHKIVIWVRNPSGILTIEQRVNAQAEGYKTLKAFAQEHNISLKGYPNKVVLSHHVVENDPLNNALKPMVSNYKQVKERIGTSVCQTSHPGRIEHEGKAREDRIIRGDKVAEGLERLVLDFPKEFDRHEKVIAEQTEAIKAQREINDEFTVNLKLHTQVLNDIRDAERARVEQDKARMELDRMRDRQNEELMKTMKAIQKGLASKEESQ